MQVVLVMFRNDGERRSFSVVRNMTVIGRREDCDLRIPVGDVSRKHCRIVTSDDEVTIEDLGSSNGTFVNHERIQQQQVINAGDIVGVGPVQFVVQIDGTPGDDELVAPNAAGATDATLDDSADGYRATAVDESADALLEEEALPAEELAEDEHALEEVPAGELTEGDELAAGELTDEEPLEELTEEEHAATSAPVGASRHSSGVLDELEVEEGALPQEPLEELEEFDETLLSEDELEEAPLGAHGSESAPLEELELDENAPAPLGEDELEELPLMPPARAEEPLEELELDEDAPGAHSAEKPGEGSAWDFVIEETEHEEEGHSLHVDLDAPHQQPHK